MRAENVKADAVTMEKVVLACHYLGEWKLVDSMVKGAAKSGDLVAAKKLFDKMPTRDVISWTCMITGYAQMMVSKINPDEITIASVLSSCAHSGTLDVDMYCKCGSIEKALAVFQEMKDKDSVSWTVAICGLAMNGESNRALNLFSQMIREAKIASDKLIELDPSNGGNYALSSNVYASYERWSDASKMREVINEGDVLKPLGWSSLEKNHSSPK
ncbi:hypothetical protein ACJIZ3_009269 [Penstemon smallii]|uniref:Pentatricopeptide repeat-containing protein n=1 Tax=Penstemon smallii TaxID=265156 RepID=A0ABD3TD97_9LAMI